MSEEAAAEEAAAGEAAGEPACGRDVADRFGTDRDRGDGLPLSRWRGRSGPAVAFGRPKA